MNDEIEKEIEIENENEPQEERSPFFLIYGLVVFLLILVGIGVWIIGSFHKSDATSSGKEPTTTTSISSTTSKDSEESGSSSSKETGTVDNPGTANNNSVKKLEIDTDLMPISNLDKERFASEKYDGIFLKMHKLDTFSENNFEVFRGLHIINTEGVVRNIDDILDVYETAYSRGMNISEMYLEFEPYDLWMQSGKNDKERDKAFGKMLSFVEKHPETTFEYLYSFPHISYWSDFTEEEWDERKEVYYHVTNLIKAYSNVFVYAPGNLEWLVANVDNYDSMFVPNENTLFKAMLYMVCDRELQFALEDVVQWFIVVKNISDCDKLGMYSYPLEEGTKLVILGDSIYDFYRDTYGAAGTISFLTGAEVYNISKGGLTAAGTADSSSFTLAYYLDGLTQQVVPEAYADTDLAAELERFYKECSTDEKLTFVLAVGINDFLNGAVSYNESHENSKKTTYGGMLSAIKKLKKAYPNSEVVVIAPYQLNFDVDLPSKFCEFLSGEPQRNYIDIIKKAAEKTGCDYMSLTETANINPETFREMLKSDCIHPTEAGEFEIAKNISKFLVTREK